MRRGSVVLLIALGAATAASAETLRLPDPVLNHIAEIRARFPERREDAFSKMGGSSAASRAFLHCFATPYVELGDRVHLSGAIDFFDTAGRSSFSRRSDAAGVNWSLRYVLGGRPANFRRELRVTQARWALILFGGNDAQNQNESIYFKRLVYLVEQLEAMGVVPVLGSALPRRNAQKDKWIQRFNRITEAVAEHWSLPYIDYHRALSALPRKGLASDGVHPNVFGRGGVKAACQLTDRGLRYGNNLRNLLTLQMLDALRQTLPDVAGTEVYPAHDDLPLPASVLERPLSSIDRQPGGEAVPDPEPTQFPVSVLVGASDLAPAAALGRGCGSLKASSWHYRARVELGEPTRLRVSALDPGGARHQLFWIRVDDGGARCVRRSAHALEVDVRPGTWDVVVEVGERPSEQRPLLLLIARDR